MGFRLIVIAGKAYFFLEVEMESETPFHLFLISMGWNREIWSFCGPERFHGRRESEIISLKTYTGLARTFWIVCPVVRLAAPIGRSSALLYSEKRLSSSVRLPLFPV